MIGSQIKTLREAKNISKEQMADFLEMSVNTYKKIEYGERAPTLDELKIIADKCDVDPVIFLRKEGTSIVNNGDYSTGVGNVIINDKELVITLTNALTNITKVLEKLLVNESKKTLQS